jgi:hypothetical protein
MSFTLDPQVRPRDGTDGLGDGRPSPPAVGDIEGPRELWNPIIGAFNTAQPIRTDVTTADFFATADDGAEILMRRYTKDSSSTGSAVVSFQGGGCMFGSVDLFDGPGVDGQVDGQSGDRGGWAVGQLVGHPSQPRQGAQLHGDTELVLRPVSAA